MTLLGRLGQPLAVAGLVALLWLGESALCSCGGPSAPLAPAAPASTDTPAPAPDGERTAAPARPALPDLSDPSWTRTPSATGAYLFVWRPEPAPIVRNQDFALELWVLDDGVPCHLTGLGISAWMPEHGHGMLRTVKAEPQADGSYRVENMLLHMRGSWVLVFDLLEGTLSERAEHALEL